LAVKLFVPSARVIVAQAMVLLYTGPLALAGDFASLVSFRYSSLVSQRGLSV